MKAYKIELLIIDHDELGGEAIKEHIESVRYPNDCLAPQVMAIECRDIGEWHDGHALNMCGTASAEYGRIFSNDATLDPTTHENERRIN